MNLFRRFFVCLLLLGAGSCLSAQWNPTAVPAPAAKSSAAPRPAEAPRAAGDATLIVFRASSVVGRLFKPTVLDNSKELAIVRDGRIVTLPLTAGEHVVSASVAGKETKLDVKPGQSYYMRMTLVTAGQFSMFKGQLTPVNEDQAKNEMAKLKPADAADLK